MPRTMPVIIRTDKESNEPVAFFPTQLGTHHDPDTLVIYTLTEAHSHAHVDYYRERTRPSTPTESRRLQRTLQSLYPDFKTITRMTMRHGQDRYEQYRRPRLNPA